MMMDKIEAGKENIQQTSTGHKASVLCRVLSQDHPQRKHDLVYKIDKFEQKLLDSPSPSSRLTAYYEYALALLEQNPEGTSVSKQNLLLPLLERCTSEFFNDSSQREEFSQDRRLVRLWLLRISLAPVQDRHEMFLHMKTHRIGTLLHVFWEEFAKFLEKTASAISQADSAFLEGIALGAQPLERLKEKYAEFKARNPQIIPKSSKFSVFVDERENRPIAQTAAPLSFPNQQSRQTENIQKPEKDWSSVKIDTAISHSKHDQPLPLSQSKNPIYKDLVLEQQSRPSYNVALFRRGCATLSFEQWHLAQILSKCPLSKMRALEPIITQHKVSRESVVKEKKSSIIPSPTINTKQAMKEIISMFSEKLVNSHSPTEESDSFDDEDEENENSFLNQVSKSNDKISHLQDNPFMPAITEEEDATLSLLPNATPKAQKRTLGPLQSTPSLVSSKITEKDKNSQISPILSESACEAFQVTPVIQNSIAEQPQDNHDHDDNYTRVRPFNSNFYLECLKKVSFEDLFPFSKEPLHLHDIPSLLSVDCIQGTKLVLSNDTWIVKDCIGEGASSKIFHCSKNEEQQENGLEAALKIQNPSNPWEFYIYTRLHANLTFCKDLVLKPLDFVRYKNCSLLFLEYIGSGTLLDCINVYLQKKDSIPEIVIIYLMMEILKALNQIHQCGIIHGDLKCENILISDDIDLPAVKIFDFGRAIDTSLVDLTKQRFFCPVDSEDPEEDCPRIREGRCFSFEIDYYGIACVAHLLLHFDYLRLQRVGNRWKPREKAKRWMKAEFWDEFFDFFINSSCPEGKPLNREVEEMFVKKMQAFVEADGKFEVVYNKHCWNLMCK